MKVMLTGGGTGGHIYPAIAIADKIKQRQPSADILFVGTERGLESQIVPKNGYPIRYIPARGFDRRRPLKNLKTLRDWIIGSQAALQLINEFRPDMVIGTGGYVSAPLVRAAQRKGIPTYIHEQNAAPGLTNRLLASQVTKLFLAYDDAVAAFSKIPPERIIVTGNPVRQEFVNASASVARTKVGLTTDDFMVLCFGGSRGALRINTVMTKAVAGLLKAPEFRLVFITGREYHSDVRRELKETGALTDRVELLPYSERMHEYLPAADLVISRAGAITVAEITACGKAAVLIPSPNVTGNHQYFNAKALADRGAAVLLSERELSEELLTEIILRLMRDRPALNQMAEASRAIGRTGAADAIYQEII